MKIIANTTDFYLDRETAVAIGKFDGVHIGHRKLLREISEQKKKGLDACVFTFDPAPAIFFGYSDGKELTTRLEKRLIFERMGVDVLIEFQMNAETAGILPEDFVTEVLVRRMKARYIVAGKDVSFGYKGAGNAVLLEQMGKKLGFELKCIDKVSLKGRDVSSTGIRTLVEKGEMEQVCHMLEMPYFLQGKVVHGNRIGRTLGFPTVNLIPGENKLLPPKGVYYSQVRVGDEMYDAITNIGYKPTVANEKVLGVESFLYDFSRDIYEEEIEVYLHAFKRPEQRFADLNALQEQLQKDIAEGRAVHEARKSGS